MAESKPVVFFNGQKYRTAIMLQNGKAGPAVTVKVTDLAAYTSATKETPATSKIVGLVSEGPVLLYKHENKYHVLAGELNIAAAQTEVQGRFVSSVSLKKARIEQPAPAVVPNTQNQMTTAFSKSDRTTRPFQKHETPKPFKRFGT